MAYDMTEERYIGTTGGGAEQDTLSSCGKRTAEDKAKIPIADSESGVRCREDFWQRCENHVKKRQLDIKLCEYEV